MLYNDHVPLITERLRGLAEHDLFARREVSEVRSLMYFTLRGHQTLTLITITCDDYRNVPLPRTRM